MDAQLNIKVLTQTNTKLRIKKIIFILLYALLVIATLNIAISSI
jgi:hypothetical protein